jgi:hypothetical protein
MVAITRAVETQITYVNHYTIDDAVVIEKFGSVKRFEELLEGADESEHEAEAMAEITEMLHEIEATESFQLREIDDTTFHLVILIRTQECFVNKDVCSERVDVVRVIGIFVLGVCF